MDQCGCCEGTQALTPQAIANRPGLATLRYRLGTHAAFLETMKARLSSLNLDIPSIELGEQGKQTIDHLTPLLKLTTRSSNDPSIALLDAWATVADVLTFYQERIANEGYLRTATERRSVLELARLVGYRMRPGVASSVYLAYTLEDSQKDPIVIPAGAKAQSTPVGPDEQMQTFETSEPLEARATWNALTPRMSQPQTAASIQEGQYSPRVYLKGINTNLKPGDPLLIDFDGELRTPYRVVQLEADAAADRTRVDLKAWPEPSAQATFNTQNDLQEISQRYRAVEAFHVSGTGKIAQHVLQLLVGLENADTAKASEIHAQLEKSLQTAMDNPQAVRLQGWLGGMVQELGAALLKAGAEAAEVSPKAVISPRVFSILTDPLQRVLSGLAAARSVPPRNTFFLTRDPERLLARRTSDAGVQVLKAFRSDLGETVAAALANVSVTASNPPRVYAFRAVARPFGHNAPPRPIRLDSGTRITITGEWSIDNPLNEPRPVAAFRALPLQGTKPLTVKFTSLSSGEVLGYSWQFGDGSLSAERNPSYTFKEAGIYMVTLTVWNEHGQDSFQSLINVDESGPTLIAETKAVNAAASLQTRNHTSNILFLDAEYNIQDDDWIMLDRAGSVPKKINLKDAGGHVNQQSLAAYGISGKSTRINLGAQETWLTQEDDFSAVRQTVVYVQSEELKVAEEPITTDICNSAGRDNSDWIELDELYSDLKSGKWVVIAGERTDVKDTNQQPVPGVHGSELVMLADVIQDVAREDGQPYYYTEETGSAETNADTDSETGVSPILAGDKVHTWIRLAKSLAYCYKRDVVKLYGNVVKATHGETRNEVLGGGDASRTLQSFELRQPPLTYVPALTPAGAQAAIKVYVNEVEWDETDELAWAGPTDHNYVIRIDDDGKTGLIFGTGEYGARLPTGQENVRAVYRKGIGKPGNVRARQIDQLATRPLGVKSVINPTAASGGADRESRDQARVNAPLAVMALDRLLSVQDYADFARMFAGIGKAAARRVPDSRQELVHVTIAGIDDIPIDESSDMYRNLLTAIRCYGDPFQPFQVALRELVLLVISANIRILPKYQWDVVSSAIRTQLLDTFSFQRRELGQDVFLGEVIRAIQMVPGVAYVDVDVFGGIPEKRVETIPAGNEQVTMRRLLTPQEITAEVKNLLNESKSDPSQPQKRRLGINVADVEGGVIHPAQLALLSPQVPDALILNRIEP
jgi:PKD repeat protein